MRYVMTEKPFAFGGAYGIKDAWGRDLCFVDGSGVSFGHGRKLVFRDLARNEIAAVQEKLLTLDGLTFEVYRGGRLYAVVKKALVLLGPCRFRIDGPGAYDLEAEGSFTHHEYVIRRAGHPIARVSKQWFSFVDTYGVDTAPGEDDVLILATTVAIDLAHARD